MANLDCLVVVYDLSSEARGRAFEEKLRSVAQKVDVPIRTLLLLSSCDYIPDESVSAVSLVIAHGNDAGTRSDSDLRIDLLGYDSEAKVIRYTGGDIPCDSDFTWLYCDFPRDGSGFLPEPEVEDLLLWAISNKINPIPSVLCPPLHFDNLRALSTLCQGCVLANKVNKWPKDPCKAEQFWSPLTKVDDLEAKLCREAGEKQFSDTANKLIGYVARKDPAGITPELVEAVSNEISGILGLGIDDPDLHSSNKIRQLVESLSSDDRNIYIAGTSVFSMAIYQSLATLLGDKRIFLVQSFDPDAIRQEMLCVGEHLESEAVLIVDYTEKKGRPEKCISLLRYLRNNINWMGGGIVCVGTDEDRQNLEDAPLTFDTMADYTFSSFACSHSVLSAPMSIVGLVSAIDSNEPLLLFQWNRVLESDVISRSKKLFNELKKDMDLNVAKELKKCLLRINWAGLIASLPHGTTIPRDIQREPPCLQGDISSVPEFMESSGKLVEFALKYS